MSNHPLANTLFESDIQQLELIHRGKVRDVYQLSPHALIMVTCDRLSAFDVVLPTPIPGKGIVLNQLSRFWFEKTAHIIPNHLLDLSIESAIGQNPQIELLAPRSAIVKRLKALPIEAVVRGFLIGSGWKDYQQTGEVCGISLPPGLELAQKLAKPIFTPASKAAVGEHDENISMAQMVTKIGQPLAEKVRDVSLRLYQFASDYARERGIIIADCKFEFGLDHDGTLVLMDELFTPDSSRFWPAEHYQMGSSPPSFDKQFVRDHLETLNWDKTAPGPELPDEIIAKTSAKYLEAYRVLTGITL